MGKLYERPEWKVFRAEVIELDGGCCRICGRSQNDGITLQVHHTVYHPGKFPWEYPTQDCQTLCQGCHGREHGIIRPAHGWHLISQDDVGYGGGTCEVCHTALKYVFHLDHEKWESVSVGTDCCDRMTGTEEASLWRRSVDRRNRFIQSVGWKSVEGGLQIKRSRMNIMVKEEDGGFRLYVQGKRARVIHETIDLAKATIFEKIEDGTAEQALVERNIPLENSSSRKKKQETWFKYRRR